MQATAVLRNAVSGLSHAASNPEYTTAPANCDNAITSNCQGEQCQESTDILLSPLLHLHENGGDMRYGFTSDARARQGRFLYVELLDH